MASVKLKMPYDDHMPESNATGLRCRDKTLTKQSFLEDTDINTIVAKFGITGELPQNVRMPTYGDFGDVFDFQSAMNAIRASQEAFNQMPANVRARFDNDAAKFVAFCDRPENLDEAQKLGLIDAKAWERVEAQRKAERAAELNQAVQDALKARETPAPPKTDTH